MIRDVNAARFVLSVPLFFCFGVRCHFVLTHQSYLSTMDGKVVCLGN